jgi:predicted amidohydrolase
MKVACIQMSISLCSKEKNLEHALSLAEEAVLKEAEILVFPEVFSTGFCYASLGELAEPISGPTIEALRTFSKEHDCILAGSIVEQAEKGAENDKAGRDKDEDKDETELKDCFVQKGKQAQYNLGFCIESGKLVGLHRKTHLYGPEKEHFVRGNRIAPIRLEKHDFSIGLIVCNELRYPEVARKLALEGADILVSAAEIPDFFGLSWRVLSLARALENQLPHIACNSTGKDMYSTYFGGSFIINPWGNILAEAGREECILIGEIDLEKAKEIRETTSIFEDRRPELY